MLRPKHFCRPFGVQRLTQPARRRELLALELDREARCRPRRELSVGSVFLPPFQLLFYLLSPRL